MELPPSLRHTQERMRNKPRGDGSARNALGLGAVGKLGRTVSLWFPWILDACTGDTRIIARRGAGERDHDSRRN